MAMVNHDYLKTAYMNWLKEKVTFKDINGILQITSPLLDRNNDRMQIYVIPDGDTLILSDDGQIINELQMSGCDIFSSNKRKEILDGILNKFGVKRDKEELFVKATINDFPQKKHFLLQAMLSVNDMFMTSRESITSIFLEEVEIFLAKNDVRYSENVSFVGKSGFTHNYDFIISKYKQAPERIIKAINNPTRDKAETLLFSWDDIRETRKSEAVLYAFLNDNDKKINKSILSAFAEYDVKPILWTQKENFIRELSA
jgi:hypothetical protein